MNIIFTPSSWEQYIGWYTLDRKKFEKINELIKDIQRNGFFKGIGQVEPLKRIKAWSRRIDQVNRLVYIPDEKKDLIIIACEGHYKNLI